MKAGIRWSSEPKTIAHERCHGRTSLKAAFSDSLLEAYGWNDIETTCEFLLEHGDDGEDNGAARRRKRYRYRWPDPVRDEVLSRLLALNAERATEESRGGGVPAHGRSPAKTVSASAERTPLYNA